MPKYKIPARFARFEDGEYVHYPAGATVELNDKEFARFATKPEPVSDDGDDGAAAPSEESVSTATTGETTLSLLDLAHEPVLSTRGINKRGSSIDSE